MAVADRSNESEGEKLNLDSAHTAAICFPQVEPIAGGSLKMSRGRRALITAVFTIAIKPEVEI